MNTENIVFFYGIKYIRVETIYKMLITSIRKEEKNVTSFTLKDSLNKHQLHNHKSQNLKKEEESVKYVIGKANVKCTKESF